LHGNAVTVHVDNPVLGRPTPAVNLAIGLSTEHQAYFGLTGALDAGPPVVRIDLAKIRQIIVDGVGVDIDEPRAWEPVSVDGRDSVPEVEW
jgi:hypothetical protein